MGDPQFPLDRPACLYRRCRDPAVQGGGSPDEYRHRHGVYRQTVCGRQLQFACADDHLADHAVGVGACDAGIEFKRYVAGKMELERADKRFFPDKPKAMGDMVAREKSMETLTKMADIMRAKEKELGTTIVLLSDEPYRELAYDGVDVPYVTNVYDNTVICYSYSKSLSLPGERIGYLVIPDALKDSGEVFNAATIANRVLGCVNAPSLMQRVILRCLDAKVNLEAYDRNRNLLYNGLKDLGFEWVYIDFG